MTIRRFLQYIAYSRDNPPDIHPDRWRALLRRYDLGLVRIQDAEWQKD